MEHVYFDDLNVGDSFWGDEVAVDNAEMMAYNRKNDPWPIHVDEDFAKQSPYGGLIASGGYTITLWYRSLQGVYNNSKCQWQFLGGLEWTLKFQGPLRMDDRVRVKLTVQSVRASSQGGRGVVTVLDEMYNQSNERIMTVEVVGLLQSRPVNVLHGAPPQLHD